MARPPLIPRSASWLALALAAPLALGVPAQGQDGSERPQVGLDQLLELPTGREYAVEKRGGMTRSEWRSRFVALREALAEARESLEKSEAQLEEVAASTEPWQLGPQLPGVTQADAPLDYRLRQEIRRFREEIERLEDRTAELKVQANLAGVPEDWRK